MAMLWKLLVVVVVWSGSGQGFGAGRAGIDQSHPNVWAKRDDVPAPDQFLRRAAAAGTASPIRQTVDI